MTPRTTYDRAGHAHFVTFFGFRRRRLLDHDRPKALGREGDTQGNPEGVLSEQWNLMRSRRASIAGLMGVVLVTSLGLAAVRSASPWWAGATFLTTCGVLALAVVGASCRGGAERVWWLGFAMFGWGYVALMLRDVNLPTVALFDALRPSLGFPPRFKGVGTDPFAQVGHCICALGAATLGGLLALFLFGTPAGQRLARDPGPRPEFRPPLKRWRRPPAVGTVGLVAAAFVAVVGLRWVPDLLAAAALLSTWGLLGLAAVGAVCGRGRRRAAWLGAALFGIGYMALIFDHDPDPPNWPHLATDRLLNSLRPWLPHYVRVFPTLSDAANACVLKALEQPVSLHYPDETPLEDVLKAIRDAVRCPDGRGIPIYVDPIGLLEAERTMQVPVSIDVEGVPLRTCLRLLMRQIEMDYRVEDGVLYIDSRGGEYTPLEASEDPFLVVGHCLLALVAAGIGGLLAPLVSDPRCEPTGRAESASADV